MLQLPPQIGFLRPPPQGNGYRKYRHAYIMYPLPYEMANASGKFRGQITKDCTAHFIKISLYKYRRHAHSAYFYRRAARRRAMKAILASFDFYSLYHETY